MRAALMVGGPTMSVVPGGRKRGSVLNEEKISPFQFSRGVWSDIWVSDSGAYTSRQLASATRHATAQANTSHVLQPDSVRRRFVGVRGRSCAVDLRRCVMRPSVRQIACLNGLHMGAAYREARHDLATMGGYVQRLTRLRLPVLATNPVR